MKLVGKPTLRDEEIFRAATEAGCKPIWRDGILGWAWHCGCADAQHAADQQCSTLTPNSIARAEAS